MYAMNQLQMDRVDVHALSPRIIHLFIWWESYYHFTMKSSICQHRWGNHTCLTAQIITNSIAQIMEAKSVASFWLWPIWFAAGQSNKSSISFFFCLLGEHGGMPESPGCFSPNPASTACEQNAFFFPNLSLKYNFSEGFFFKKAPS